jgi:hypothetical protein
MVIFIPLKKAFHILFCIYFLALLVVPCGDKDDCNETTHSEIAQANDHKKHSGEVCTPFCSCACCASHFLSNDLQPNLEIVAVINTVYTVHKESKISSAIISIW